MNRVYITSFSSISAVGVGIKESIDNLKTQKQSIIFPDEKDKYKKPYFKINNDLDINNQKTRCSQITLTLLSLIEDDLLKMDPLPILFATSTGGIKETEEAYLDIINKNKIYPVFERHFFNKMFDDVKEVYKDKFTDSMSFSTACSSSGHSIMQAYKFIKNGIIDKAVVVGVDSLSLTTMIGFDSLKLVSETGTKPLTVNRDGLSLGEGGGVLLLESNPHIEPAAEIVGCSTTTDGYHISSPDPNGTYQKECILESINQAEIDISDIDYINAHGTGTNMNDKVEVDAIKSIFTNDITVTSTKSFIGHTLGASAIIEIALVIGMLKEKKIFQVTGLGDVMDKDIIPDNTVCKEVKYFLKNSFGFGGNNVSMIIKNLI